MGKRSKTVGVQLDLELVAPPAPAEPRIPGLWEAVDAFPLRAAAAHRRRRKVVFPRPAQVSLLEPLPAPREDE